jgi:uncharacterized protein
MPIIPSSYHSILKSGHLHTIFPTIFRFVKFIAPDEICIDTPDGDFLQLDVYKRDSKKLIIISHGLEGNSNRAYVRGMARHFYENNYNVIAWNCRTCGSKLNNTMKLYHSGVSYDLKTVVDYALSLHFYDEISLIGFSMGGNITLKYLGEEAQTISPMIKSAVAISVPVDLTGSCGEMMKPKNKLYMKRFIIKLGKKLALKAEQFPDKISLDNYRSIQNFKDFDDRYTAPLNGFSSAEDYWTKVSSLPLLSKVCIPTLIINAKNDSFLSPTCYPYELAQDSKYIHLETPEQGGHVGFWCFSRGFWTERRALEFCENSI